MIKQQEYPLTIIGFIQKKKSKRYLNDAYFLQKKIGTMNRLRIERLGFGAGATENGA
jgi:hypothetical protein